MPFLKYMPSLSRYIFFLEKTAGINNKLPGHIGVQRARGICHMTADKSLNCHPNDTHLEAGRLARIQSAKDKVKGMFQKIAG